MNVSESLDWLREGFNRTFETPVRSFVSGFLWASPLLLSLFAWSVVGFFASILTFACIRYGRAPSEKRIPWGKMLSLSAFSWLVGLLLSVILFYMLRLFMPMSFVVDMMRTHANGNPSLLSFAFIGSWMIPGLLSLSFFLLCESILSKRTKDVYKSITLSLKCLQRKFLSFVIAWTSIVLSFAVWFAMSMFCMKVIDRIVSPQIFFLLFFLLSSSVWGLIFIWGVRTLECAIESLLPRK